MTEDANAMITLSTGASVPSSALTAIYTALKTIEANPDPLAVLALFEARALAANPDHALWPGTAEILDFHGLIKHGRMHDSVRDIVLAVIKSDGESLLVKSPFTE